MKQVLGLILGSSIAILIFVSCTGGAFYEENKKLENFIWTYDNPADFNVTIDDTVTKYHLKVNIRHREIYPYKNMWIQILTTFPKGEKSEQLVNLPLADKEGHWYGKKTGDIVMQSITIQPNAIMPEIGTYKFVINQHMRMDSLEAIMDVGLRVEKLD